MPHQREHRRVVGQHRAVQPTQAGGCGDALQRGDGPFADATALPRSGDHQREFGTASRRIDDVARIADQRLPVGGSRQNDARQLACRIDFDHAVQALWRDAADRAVKAPAAVFWRQAADQRIQRGRVAGVDRAQGRRRAVTQGPMFDGGHGEVSCPLFHAGSAPIRTSDVDAPPSRWVEHRPARRSHPVRQRCAALLPVDQGDLANGSAGSGAISAQTVIRVVSSGP